MNRKIVLLPLVAAGLILAGCGPTEETSSSSSSSKSESTGTSVSTGTSESTGTTDPTLVETGKLGLWQTNIGEAQYFTGEMDGFYFGTTTDFEAAVTINVRSVENGLTLQIGDGQYIAARLSGDGEHNNIIMQDEAYTWSYNEEYDAYYTNLGGSDLWIGNSQKFDTISLNDWKYIANAGNNVAHVVQSAITAPEGGETGGSSESNSSSEEVTLTPTDEVPENNQVLGVERTSDPKGFYYWTGEMDDRYLKTTTVFAEAAKLTFEAVTGGFAIKVADNSYLNAVASGTSWGMELSSNKGVWSLSEEGALITSIDGKGYYLGTYSNFTTMSLSGYSHFGGNGNYVAKFYMTEPTTGGEPSEPDTPSTEVGNSLTIVAEDLALDTYADGEATLSGIDFAWTELGDYGNGIQMRNKNGKNSAIWNKTAFTSEIESIDINWNSKTAGTKGDLVIAFGTAAIEVDGTESNLFYEDVAKTTVACDVEGATYFRLNHGTVSGGIYIDSIVINFAA